MSLTNQIRYTRALDSTATDGSGKVSLAFGDITAKYLTQGGTLVSLTTETITTLGTYQAPSSSVHIRIKELSSSDPCKGVYEIHFHNTQVLSTGIKLWLFLSASGAAFQPLEVDLTDISGRLPAALASSGNILADVDTIKANPVVNAGTVTFPTTATLANGTVTTPTSAAGVFKTFDGTTLSDTTETCTIFNYHDKTVTSGSLILVVKWMNYWWFVDVFSCTVLSLCSFT